MSDRESLQVKVVLKGDHAKQFAFIKTKRGLEHDSEVIRYLIAREYERIASRSE